MKQLFKDFPLTFLCVAGIWVLCLIPIPETPLSDVPLIDKWTHFVMYGGLVLLFRLEYERHRRAVAPFRQKTLWFLIWLAPIAMGGLIELAQAYLTGGNRSGDWMDFLADSIGVLLGNILCDLFLLCHKMWKRK